jgi:desulfoferrodoxin (superoxide reductase-like protein)
MYKTNLTKEDISKLGEAIKLDNKHFIAQRFIYEYDDVVKTRDFYVERKEQAEVQLQANKSKP